MGPKANKPINGSTVIELPKNNQSSKQKIGEGRVLKMPRILLLDDDPEMVDLCANALKRRFLVVKSSSPLEALSLVDAGRFMIDLIVCDYYMPGMNGEEFVEKIRTLYIDTPAILYTGKVIDDTEGLNTKFVKVIQKPFSAEKLRSEVENALSALLAPLPAPKPAPQIDATLIQAMQAIETYLRDQGLENPRAVTEAEAIAVLKSDQARAAYRSWQELRGLTEKLKAA